MSERHHQYLDEDTVEMYSDDDTFCSPIFVNHLQLAEGKPHQGWVNSATWCFNLYFMQEPKLCEALRRLIRKDGTINLDRAIKLFSRRSGIRIDKECEGKVFVPEIIDTFLKEQKEANDLCLNSEGTTP